MDVASVPGPVVAIDGDLLVRTGLPALNTQRWVVVVLGEEVVVDPALE